VSELRATKNSRPIHILLVDDDDDDVELTKITLERDRALNTIDRVVDGVEAMQFLRREGEYAEARRPDLVLLDLNMPRKDGREVLQEIKGDPKLATIPVVVFTSSDHERDILTTYKYQANSYVTKPVDLGEFRAILRDIRGYWMSVVTLPTDAIPVS